MSGENTPHEVDCLVLGGGITGAGVARDAALRGLRVLLADSNDFASGTSHLTSKLIHGGLRYLDHGYIRPVIEATIERYRLLTRLAPNLVRPLKFVMPFEGHGFLKWAATLCGLQLYGLPEWYRCGRSSDPMLGVRLRRDYPAMRPHPFAVTFWDAQTNDARLVLATLRTARNAGAVIHNYTSITGAQFRRGVWTIDLRSESPRRDFTIRSRSIVNATGPWSPLAAEQLGTPPMHLMWIKGSHMMLPRFEHFGEDAIVIRSVRDRRPLWVIPWHNRLIVGTTESQYEGDLRDARPTVDEIDDLFESFVYFFPSVGLSRGDICCAYAGIRPIIPQSVQSENSLSREHRIEVDPKRRLVTILGGKLTTFRHMAEQTLDRIDRLLGRQLPATALRRRLRGAPLWPGLSPVEARKLRENLARLFPQEHVEPEMMGHLLQHYGWDASLILRGIDRRPHLGRRIVAGLPYCPAELAYLCQTEQVVHLVDLVKRRTPLYFLADDCTISSLPGVVEELANVLGWDGRRRRDELAAVAAEWRADLGPCGRDTLVASAEHQEAVPA